MIFRFSCPAALALALALVLSGCSGSSEPSADSPRAARMKFAEDAGATPAPEPKARPIPTSDAALVADLKRIMAREWNVRASKIQVEPALLAQNLSLPGNQKLADLDIAELVMTIEDEYDITLEDEELTGKTEDKEALDAYKQLSLRRLADVVASKRKK